jgi:hypothetical protein
VDELLAEFDRLAARISDQNAGFTDEEVSVDVTAAIAETRREWRLSDQA